MKKTTLFALAFYGITASVWAQNPTDGAIQGETLWLRNEVNSVSRSTDKEAYHFNFNAAFSPNDTKDFLYKNVLESKYSLFVVFKSDLEEEVTLLNLKMNGANTILSNKQLINDKTNTFKKVNAKQGIVLSYLVSHQKKGRKKSSLILENLSRPRTEEGYRNDIMELLYYPRVLNGLEKQKIESYLSIKYGISLLGEVDYVNSGGKKIWDSKENKSYNYRVTGIGKDDLLHLDQKQSGNAEKDGLYIGFETIQETNKTNTALVQDRTALIWGDNGGALKMEANKRESSKVKKMKRVWKMQSTLDSLSTPLPTQLMIDKLAFAIEEKKEQTDKKDDFMWLLIDRNGGSDFDYQHAEYYMQSRDEEGKIYFDNVVWDADKNGSDRFTFIQGPDFFVQYEIAETDCDQDKGEAKMAIIGGKAPFKLDFTTPTNTESYTIEERSFRLSDLAASNYVMQVTDKMQRKQNDTLTINGLKNVSLTLAPQWDLNASKETIIAPEIKNPEGQQLKFVWRKGEHILSEENQLTATEEGDYSLTFSNEMGCQTELLFKVTSSEFSNNRWTLYPNPAKMDEHFTVKFNLEKESDVSVAIFDFSNKLLKRKELGKIKASEYSETLSTIGTFLLIVTIDGKAESAKIIIR